MLTFSHAPSRYLARLLAIAMVAFTMTALSRPVLAAAPSAPTEGDGHISPEHIITCLHFATAPAWAGGDTVAGMIYWSCTDRPDIKEACGQMRYGPSTPGFP